MNNIANGAAYHRLKTNQEKI